MKKLLLFLIAVSAWGAPCAGANGYTFCQTLVLDHTKVPSNQSNYPAAICFGTTMGPHCLANTKQLATAAHGGFLQDNTNGFDFIITSDSGGTMALNYERVIHNLTTGDTELWVLLPSISSTVDLTIYLFYGNAAVSTDQSNATAVWDADYLAVHHLQVPPGGTYTTMVGATDSTTANPMAINEAPVSFDIDSITGIVGAAVDFNAHACAGGAACAFVNQGPYTNFPPTISPEPFTLEGWFNVNGQASNGSAYCFGNNNVMGDRWNIYWNGIAGSWFIEGFNVGVSFPGATTGWHRIVTILPSGQTTYANAKAYVDGVSQTVTNVSGGTTTVAPTYTGANGYASGLLCGRLSPIEVFHGLVDELRLSKIERSQDWVTTDYNNQSNVAAFWSNSTVGSTGGSRTIIIN